MFEILSTKASLGSLNWEIALASLLCTVFLSGAIAITYYKTTRGMSFSQNYIEAMILASVVASVIMMAIGDSIGRGLGMMGALAIIRFRTNIRETRDIVFLFASLGVGIGCGVFALDVSFLGAAVFCITAFVLGRTNWGGEEKLDGVVRLQMKTEFANQGELEKVMRRNCRNFILSSVREAKQGTVVEITYQVALKDGIVHSEWIKEIKAVGVNQVQFAATDQGGDWL